MIEFSKVTVSKEGAAVIGTFTYNITASIQNDVLLSVTSQIHKKDIEAPVGDQGVYVGAMQNQNGRTTFEFPEDSDFVIHVTNFTKIVDEVKSELLSKAGKKNPTT